MENSCPNIESCNLVVKTNIVNDETKRNEFMISYCNDSSQRWKSCKRYIVKNAINFCPDFVLPDSNMTPDQVIDKFDLENN